MGFHSGYLSPSWMKARVEVEVFRRSRSSCPNLATDCVRFLEDWLSPNDRVLEYGSGVSTAWFGSHAESVVSVENDPIWYGRVVDWTRDNDRIAVHQFCGPIDPTLDGAVCADYVGFLDTLPSDHFNLILDDGWARGSVALRALRSLKPGGLLLFDDHSVDGLELIASTSSRPFLGEFLGLTRHWRKATWDDGNHRTAGFFKP